MFDYVLGPLFQISDFQNYFSQMIKKQNLTQKQDLQGRVESKRAVRLELWIQGLLKYKLFPVMRVKSDHKC